MRTWLVIFAVGGVVVTGCGGSASSECRVEVPPPATATTSTTAPASDPVTTPSAPTAAANERASRIVAAGEVDAQTIVRGAVTWNEDVGRSWTATRSRTESSYVDLCGDSDPLADSGGTLDAYAESQYQRANDGPFIASMVAQYTDGESAAKRRLHDLEEEIASCDQLTETSGHWAITKYKARTLSFPDLGDETFAARLTSSSSDGPADMEVVATRTGDVIAAVFYGAVQSVDSSVTKRVQERMVSRLEACLP